MASGQTAQSVSAFLNSYRTAFERLDAPAIAEHFAYPSHITSDGDEMGLVAVAAKEAWTGTIEHLLGMYRSIGFGSARIRDASPTVLSPRLMQALVHWELHDAKGHLLYDFQAVYTLARVGETLRITAIAHNEMPRYRACLARLRSQGS